MYLSLIFYGIFSAATTSLLGRKLGNNGAILLSCISLLLQTIILIICVTEVGIKCISIGMKLFNWIQIESLNIYLNFYYDSLTVSMLVPVLLVSFGVHIYSKGYMDQDPHVPRFFSYLTLFTFMMIILVTSDNFLLMFVGWEGVGICSYLLVSFWFTRLEANKSSISAFLTNRVGDCFLTIGMLVIIWSISSIQYNIVFSISPYINENIITIIGICLLIGAMAKSAQVGLHVWLPMAMEGPTPVSALIHAATMVTAGVYLLIRSSPLIEYSTTVLTLCLWLGAITTIFSSLVGLFQQDIKKVIAYSTMSQLGMMVIAIGLSSYNIALFHLVNHAFYKALLFLGAGAVIHSVADSQDFRKYGGLISYLPLTYTVMLIASLSLVAIPFMTGFYSKDLILESSYGDYNMFGIIVYFIAVIGAMFTTLYSAKLLYLTFLTSPNGPIINYKNIKPAHEGSIFMNMPLIILAIFSIYFGYLTKDIFIGLGSGFFSDNSLFIHPLHEILLNTEFAVPTLFKLLPLFFTISLTILSLVFSEFFIKSVINFKFLIVGYYIFSFFSQRFYVEFIYNRYISNAVLNLGGQTTKFMDKGLVEFIGPFGLRSLLTNLSRYINSLSTGIVTYYALYILIGLTFYICIFYLINLTKFFITLLFVVIGLTYLAFNNNTINNNKVVLNSQLDLKWLIRIFITILPLIFGFTTLFSLGKTLGILMFITLTRNVFKRYFKPTYVLICENSKMYMIKIFGKRFYNIFNWIIFTLIKLLVSWTILGSFENHVLPSDGDDSSSSVGSSEPGDDIFDPIEIDDESSRYANQPPLPEYNPEVPADFNPDHSSPEPQNGNDTDSSVSEDGDIQGVKGELRQSIRENNESIGELKNEIEEKRTVSKDNPEEHEAAQKRIEECEKEITDLETENERDKRVLKNIKVYRRF